MVPFKLSWWFAILVMAIAVAGLVFGASVAETMAEEDVEFNGSVDGTAFIEPVNQSEYDEYRQDDKSVDTIYAIEQHDAIILVNSSSMADGNSTHPVIKTTNGLWPHLNWYFDVGLEYPERAETVAMAWFHTLLLGWAYMAIRLFRRGPPSSSN